jgi:hypothetical protein
MGFRSRNTGFRQYWIIASEKPTSRDQIIQRRVAVHALIYHLLIYHFMMYCIFHVDAH